jgi:class 3 adenylate cyclase
MFVHITSLSSRIGFRQEPLLNVARQICELAEPGQVVVSNVVRELVAGKGFRFAPVGEKMLKGSDNTVALYRLDVG